MKQLPALVLFCRGINYNNEGGSIRNGTTSMYFTGIDKNEFDYFQQYSFYHHNKNYRFRLPPAQ